jgi:formate-dependent nitrite reductase membrane component NrfD
MEPFKQNEFGKRVAVDFLLSGTGSSMFIIYYLVASIMHSTLNIIMLLTGPAFILVGLFILLSELGKPSNFWRSMINYRTSWMSRGAIFNIVYVTIGLGILLAHEVGLNYLLPWISVAGFVCALLVLVYPAMLLHAVKDIPVWNSSSTIAITLLFAIAGGGAATLAMSTAIQYSMISEILRILLMLEVFLALSVMFYAIVLRKLSRVKKAAAASFKMMQHNGGLYSSLIFGTVVPVALYLLAIFFSGTAKELAALIGSIFSLYGTYAFRLMLLNAGYHEPLITEKNIGAKGLLI